MQTVTAQPRKVDLAASVIAAYDAAPDNDARSNAIAVLMASRTQLIDTAGALTAQRDALVVALKAAIGWLELLTPAGEIPGMAALRAALEPAPVRVSHGICLPCVQRLYPQMLERVTAAVAKAAPRDPGLSHVCCYCLASMDQVSA